MKVLMFGWEFPPHISGGLGTACYGLTRALVQYPGVDLTFVVPKAWGDERAEKVNLLGANQVDLIKSKISREKFFNPFNYLTVQSEIIPYVDPDQYEAYIKSQKEESLKSKDDVFSHIKFTGDYTPDLLKEIHNFAVVGEYIASDHSFDVIHAHDWLTFPAGILAKKKTGKPLVVHVHATDFDRSGGNANPKVFAIEREGMENADRIITVSDHTAHIVQQKYGINPAKIVTVHNGVEFNGGRNGRKKETKGKLQTVTFLGRITAQKGPGFFVEIARKVLERMKNVQFVMAGSGDMLKQMKDQVQALKLNGRFLFPGFLKGEEVNRMLRNSDVYIMPSVSEPFGISPLEAMYSGVPVIISNQSGVSEVVNHVIKLDFWDTDAMADAVHSILTRPALAKMLVTKGVREVRKITWENTALKTIQVYDYLIRA